MNKSMLWLTLLLVVGIVGVVAYQGVFSSQERTNIQNAIKNNDFNAWKAAIESGLTQDNFNRIVANYQKRQQFGQERQAVADAIKSNDYNAYVSAFKNLTSSMSPVNQSDFNIMSQIYQAEQSGNYTEARQLRSELGPIGPGMGGVMGPAMRMKHRGY